MATSQPPPPPAEGDAGTDRMFGHYLLTKELGRGAQGIVHLAVDVSLQRKVALKVLTEGGAQSPGARDRFRREAEMASRIEHPGICGVHEVGEVDGVPFIAMQYVRGTTLADVLDLARKQRRPAGADPTASITIGTGAGGGDKVGLQDIVQLIERTASAIHVAHEAGLVHRDIKPGNIMVTPEGDPVVLDFGLARDTAPGDHTMTKSGQIMGTPAYLSPEQVVAASGGVDRRADIYALGVTLFECLTLQRPYETQTFEQLFQQILAGNLPNPRKLNPRIPQDLRTVVEVAVDVDRERRYATAAAFAEDLRRVRAFEPITARAAGPWTRLRKWSRRNPGRAASAAAALLVVTGGSVALAWNGHARRVEIATNLAAAAQHLAASRFDAANAAIALVLDRAPDSLRARELRAAVAAAREAADREARRLEALGQAAAARAEAAALLQQHASVQQELGALREELARRQPQVFGGYASEADHADYADREKHRAELELATEQALSDAQQALERAARLESPWDGPSPATEAALAEFYRDRWREAFAGGEVAKAASLRVLVERYDHDGRYRNELLGHGSLSVAVTPPTAELFLFRLEDRARSPSGPIVPRRVPVPTTGLGVTRDGAWCQGFGAGDACLRVDAVAPGSIAAAAGLVQGDLVVAVDDLPVGGGAFLRLGADDPLAGAGLPPIVRIEALGDAAIEHPFDWRCAVDLDAGSQLRVRGHAAPVAVDAQALTPVGPAELVAGGAPVPMRLRCLRAGDAVELDVPAGAGSGLRCALEAYPLLLAPGNRIPAGPDFAAEAGSYLVVARAAGHEDQAVPIVLGRNGTAHADIVLQPPGLGPPGFVYVAPGPFRRGADPGAFQPAPTGDVEVDGFWLQRYEVDNASYFAFLNDPDVRREVAASGNTLRVPRDGQGGKLLAALAEDGWHWVGYRAAAATTPVLGISWSDARAYVEWRNRQAERDGEPWRYDLPGTDEWEKAARGVDARFFPWGDRFDTRLATCGTRKPWTLLDAPGGYEPRDTSVYGVRDLGGSREEWTRDARPLSDQNQTQRVYYKLGGSWASTAETIFRCASRPNAGEGRAASSYGFRLVARRR